MSIHSPRWIPAVPLMVPWLAVLVIGCGGDQSLGGGVPLADASTLDAPDIPDETRICSSHEGLDAEPTLAEGLLAWYRCEVTAGSSLVDSTPHGNDGTLVSGTGDGQGSSFAAGKVGDALYLTLANKGYVSLPEGILAEACDVTIATWVYINSNVNAWTRIWDFGQGTKTYMFLTPITNTDEVARFAISVSGNTHEEVIKAASSVPTLKWTHVALVLGPSGGILYFDGSPVGTNTSMKLRPANLGATVNNYIGRSEFSQDPYLDGDIDEFRIYNRALSPEEIRALAAGS
jgi:hypothetical protein